MGNSAKIRHRRRRREQLARSFDTVVEEVVAERQNDRGRPVDELDDALTRALRDLDPK